MDRILPSAVSLRRAGDAAAAAWPARMRATNSSSGRSPSPRTTRSKGPSSNMSSGRNVASMPPAMMKRPGRHAAHEVRELQIEAQRHPGGRNRRRRPRRRSRVRARSAVCGGSAAAIRIENLDRDAGGFEHARQAAKRRAAARGRCIRRSADRRADQQYPRRASICHVIIIQA